MRVYSPSTLLDASRTRNVPSGVFLITSFTSCLIKWKEMLICQMLIWYHFDCYPSELPLCKNTLYLEMFPQYHSARDRWSSPEPQPHAAITSVVSLLCWTSDRKGTRKWSEFCNYKLLGLLSNLLNFSLQNYTLNDDILRSRSATCIGRPVACWTSKNQAGKYLVPWKCWSFEGHLHCRDQQKMKRPADAPSEC